MFVDQTKVIDGYTAASSLEKGKLSSADKVLEGNSILDYGKMQESYRMTDGGSFYMPNAVYQKPEGKEAESIVDQLDDQMDMSAANRKNQMVVVSNTASSAFSITVRRGRVYSCFTRSNSSMITFAIES